MKSISFLLWRVSVALVIVIWPASIAVADIEIVTDGLVSFWSLDKSSIVGGTVRDLWGNNHGFTEGETEIVGGRINEALSFDGMDDYVEVDHHESLNLAEAITIEFWFLLKGPSSDNEYPRTVSKGQSTTTDGAYGIWVKDTTGPTDIGLRSVTLAPNDIRSQALPSYDDNAWHHVAVTYDGKQGRLFLDGAIHVDAPTSGELAQTNEPLHIGDGNNQRHFNGAIDEVRIYSRALSEAEILQNYNAKSNSLAVSAEYRLVTLWSRLKAQ